jgi:flagellar basal-body rod protein FlgG
MRIGCTLASCSLVFAACAAPPAAMPAGATERIAMLEQQVAALGAMVATPWWNGPIAAAATPRDDAALVELSARIGALTDQIAAARSPAAVDAAATRGHAATPATTGAILALRDALLAIDQMRAVCVENLANVNTPGWKRRLVEWTTTSDAASGLQLPRVQRIATSMTAGAIAQTERALDVAIDGDGFFTCLAADGERRYTRAGALHVDADGRLVTSAGMRLDPPCAIPADTLEVTVDPTGAVRALTAGKPNEPTPLGSLQLARFAQSSALTAASDNTYRATAEAGAVTHGAPGSPGFGLLRQGFVERSNVQLTNELIDLQIADRQRRVVVHALAGFGVHVP